MIWEGIGDARFGRESVVMSNELRWVSIVSRDWVSGVRLADLWPPALSLVAFNDLLDALFCEVLMCVPAECISGWLSWV